MAVIHTNLTCDLQKAVKVFYLDGNLFSQDNQANQFHVTVLDGGSAATISGTVTADVIRSDGGTVTVTGSLSGNVANVTFPAAVYAIPGVVSIVVKLTTSGVITTIAAVVANIYQSSTNTPIDPGTIIPSVTTLITAIETAVASIPADYSSLWTSLAPAFNSNNNYVAGQYVTYNGGVYRFNTAHSGSWAAGDVSAVNIGGELQGLKSALQKEGISYEVFKYALQKEGISYEVFKYASIGGKNFSFAFQTDNLYRMIHLGGGTITLSSRNGSTTVDSIVSNLGTGQEILYVPSANADTFRMYCNSEDDANAIMIIYGSGETNKLLPAYFNIFVNDDYPVIARNKFFNKSFKTSDLSENTNYKRLLSDFVKVGQGSTISIPQVSGYKSKVCVFGSESNSDYLSETQFDDLTSFTNSTNYERYVKIGIKRTDEAVILPGEITKFTIFVNVNLKTISKVPSVMWIDGYYLDSDGKFAAAATQSIAVVDVSAYAGGKHIVKTRIASGACVGYYDEHMYPIKVETHSSYGSFSNVYDIPASARKAIISCTSSYKETQFFTECYGLSTGVKNVIKLSAVEYVPPQNIFAIKGDKADFHFDSTTKVQDVYDWFEMLTEVFDRNMTKVKLCDSTTPTGEHATIDSSIYPINAYIIQGDNYVAGNDVIIHAGIHGPNWEDGDGIVSVVCLCYFIRDLLVNHWKNPYLSFLKNHCKLLVVPVLNPWGYQNSKRTNGRGVDCNRNWDLNFEPGTGGTEPFSENETLYYKNYIAANFSNAKFCIDLHTRGTGMLPSTDKRWFEKNTEDSTLIPLATMVAKYMKSQYGGTTDLQTDAVASLPPTARAYIDHVLEIPATLIECACGVGPNRENIVRNSELVIVQYVNYIGSMVQKYLEAKVMS